MRQPLPFWYQAIPFGLESEAGPLGPSSAYNPRRIIFAKILGKPGVVSGTGLTAYCFRTMTQTASGNDSTDANGYASAGSGCSPPAGTQPTGYAYELYGRTDVPTDGTAIVQIWPSHTSGAGGSEWFFIWATGDTAGSSLTVDDDKGHTFTPVSEMIFIYNTVSLLSAGFVQILPDDTAYNVHGIINTAGTQWLGKDKKGADVFYSPSFQVAATTAPHGFPSAVGAIIAIGDVSSSVSWGVDIVTWNNQHFRVILRGSAGPAGFYGELDGGTYAGAYAVSDGAGNMKYGITTTFATGDARTATYFGGLLTDVS